MMYKSLKGSGYLLILSLLLLMGACYPGKVEDISEVDSVLTVYDEEQDFKEFKTYYVPDTVVRIGDEEVEISDKFDGQIVAKVKENMEALGYVEEMDPENNEPDVVVLCEKSVSRKIIVTIPPWWGWWGWGGWWPPYPPGGWWPGYPGCCYSTTSYTSGTLFMTMYDIKNADMGTGQLPARWRGIGNGVVQGTTSSTETRIINMIDQAFAQSSYLQTQQ